MSVHRSLRTAGKLKRHRNVLTRTERLAKLQDENIWEEGKSVFGLPKVKVLKTRRKKVAKKEEELADAAAEGAKEGETPPADDSTAKDV